MIVTKSRPRHTIPFTVTQRPIVNRQLKNQTLTARWITENGKLVCVWGTGKSS